MPIFMIMTEYSEKGKH